MSDSKVLTEHVKSAVVLANAGALTASIIKNIAGNDISNSLNGNSITRDTIIGLAARRITTKLLARNK